MRVRALPATLDRVQAQTNAGTFTWGVGGSFGGQSHPHTPSAPLQMEMSVTAITMFRRLHTHTHDAFTRPVTSALSLSVVQVMVSMLSHRFDNTPGLVKTCEMSQAVRLSSCRRTVCSGRAAQSI